MGQVIDTKRREFLLQLSLGCACSLCLEPSLLFLNGCTQAEDPVSSIPATDNPVISIDAEAALQNVGGAVKKRITTVNSGKTIIIVRSSSTSFIVFRALCTHEGTEINLPVSGTMTCPNHGSKFSTADGRVIQGPAVSSLPAFTATFDAGKNTVTIK